MAKLYGKNSYNNDWMQLLDLPLKAAQLDISERELAQKQSAQQAFLKAMQGGGLGGDNPPLIKIPDPSSPIGVRLEVDPRWKAQIETQQQTETAQAKEREVAIGKAERLKTVGKTIEKQWLNTSPYRGAITKTGLVPALGMWDIIKKGAGATDAQRRDQAYASFISGVRAQLARGMGDVGNLSEYEQRAVIQLVPTFMDSYESGMLKLGQLAQLVDDIKTTRGGKQGKEMQTFEVEGVKYNIPKDKIDAFKKAKGIK